MSKQDDSKYDFYRRTGATPPSHEEHGIEDSLKNPLSEQLRSIGDHLHRWEMKDAIYIECSVGPVTHGQPVPSPLHILTGTSPDGRPLYKVLQPAHEDD